MELILFVCGILYPIDPHAARLFYTIRRQVLASIEGGCLTKAVRQPLQKRRLRPLRKQPSFSIICISWRIRIGEGHGYEICHVPLVSLRCKSLQEIILHCFFTSASVFPDKNVPRRPGEAAAERAGGIGRHGRRHFGGWAAPGQNDAAHAKRRWDHK